MQELERFKSCTSSVNVESFDVTNALLFSAFATIFFVTNEQFIRDDDLSNAIWWDVQVPLCKDSI